MASGHSEGGVLFWPHVILRSIVMVNAGSCFLLLRPHIDGREWGLVPRGPRNSFVYETFETLTVDAHSHQGFPHPDFIDVRPCTFVLQRCQLMRSPDTDTEIVKLRDPDGARAPAVWS